MAPGIRNVEQVGTEQSQGKNQIKFAHISPDFTSSEIFLTQKVFVFMSVCVRL